jgi:prepilin-type processing-associated H-X9-DG protein
MNATHCSHLSRRSAMSGFTMVELLVAGAIVAVLAALLMAGLGNVKETSNRAICVSNLRNLSRGVLMLATENGGYFPAPLGDGSAPSWDGQVLPYLSGKYDTSRPTKLLQCPEDKRPMVINAATKIYPRSYKLSCQPANQKESPMGVVGYWDGEGGSQETLSRRIVEITKPSDTILIFENFTENNATPGYVDNWQYRTGSSLGSGWQSAARITGYRAGTSRKLYHGKLLNFGMADGHVESAPPNWAHSPTSKWDAVRN